VLFFVLSTINSKCPCCWWKLHYSDESPKFGEFLE
jgi:hypothetical protein